MIEQYLKQVEDSQSLEELDIIRLELIGKKGMITKLFLEIKALSGPEKASKAAEINSARDKIVEAISKAKQRLEDEALEKKIASERIDVTLNMHQRSLGGVHPITQAKEEILSILASYGFSVMHGPDIEDSWYNFTALNFPDNHPAKEAMDTFYMKGSEDMILRTHTSPMQIKGMKAGKPPFAFVVPGRTYRADSDATHTPMFHQIEGLMIDENIHMGHLKFILQELVAKFFEKDDIKMRLRPNFFPFTEPSAEVDIKMKDSWLEVLGSGMVHPNVLENAGIDSKKYQGFAFGLGIERFAMLKYGIQDLRDMYGCRKQWLEHYSFKNFEINNLLNGLYK